MTHRYCCVKMMLCGLALIVGPGTTSSLGQVSGACCYDTFAGPVVAGKVLSFPFACQQVGVTECISGLGGEYEGDGTQCGSEISWLTLQGCRDATIQLPVELISFDAIVEGGGVVLTWSTASETDNAGFSVEHEIGSDLFTEIGFVAGNGTTDEPKEYIYPISDLDPGLHRFRLKQVDFGGTFDYSPVVETTVTVPDRFLIRPAYPNPFNPSTTIQFAVATEQHVDVTLVNTAGRSVRTLYRGTVAANEMQQLTVDASGLPSGTYLVRFKGNGLSATEQIVLAK